MNISSLVALLVPTSVPLNFSIGVTTIEIISQKGKSSTLSRSSKEATVPFTVKIKLEAFTTYWGKQAMGTVEGAVHSSCCTQLKGSSCDRWALSILHCLIMYGLSRVRLLAIWHSLTIAHAHCRTNHLVMWMSDQLFHCLQKSLQQQQNCAY